MRIAWMNSKTQNLEEQSSASKNSDLKRRITNQLRELCENSSKCLTEAQENTNIWQREVSKTTQDLKTKCSREIWKKTQTEIKMEFRELNNPIRNSGLGLRKAMVSIRGTNQAMNEQVLSVSQRKTQSPHSETEEFQ